MDVVLLPVLFVVGILAGGVGGLLGIGGCAIMMPVIRFGFDFAPTVAVGTTLVAVVFTAAAGAFQHWRLGNVDWKSVKYIAIAGVIGVLGGSALFYYIREHGALIDLIVGLAFLWPAARMLYEGMLRRAVAEVAGSELLGSKQAKAAIGGFVGFLTGVIGLGGGYALVPSFIYILRSPLRIAIGSSMASFVWFAIVGAIIKAAQGFTDIPAAVVLGLGAAGGAVIGARLVARFKPATLKAIFGVIFLYVSLKYVLLYFGITI
jgi:uncharacterized membrane protein YfcA